MALLSKYPGKCSKCGQRFVVNKDMIEKSDGRWHHVDCSKTAAGSYYSGKIIKEAQTYTTGIEQTKNVPVDISALEDVLEAENVEEPQAQDFSPTEHQQVIFDFVEKGKGHAVIEAVAGSGKTTTIVKALDLTPKDADVAFVAFNTHIAKELKRRAPEHVYVSTLHSLGLFNLRTHFGKQPKIEDDKVGKLLNQFYPVSKEALQSGIIDKKTRSENYVKRASMRKLVSMAKSILVDPQDGNAVLDMIQRYNIEIDDMYIDELIGLLPQVLEQCMKQTDVIDFDDMLWLPIVLNISLKQFDFLMVDEAQDMNKTQIEFILRSIKDTGRIIAVGDRNQSLYAFRGADSDAIPNIIKALNAVVLPLSVTFRCPNSHVAIAKRIVPQIEPRPNAPDGEVMQLNYSDVVKTVEVGDLVICRNNAPLVRPAFECIRRGKKAVIRGMEIGSTLINLVKRFEANDLSAFDVALGEYYEYEYTKLMDKGEEIQASALQDKVETLRSLMGEVRTIPELINKITMIFSDDVEGVVFSSVHRAKGLEANSVFLLRPDLMPSKKAKRDYEIQQELNCLYVAVTRSKSILYFVKGDEHGAVKGELSLLLSGGDK